MSCENACPFQSYFITPCPPIPVFYAIPVVPCAGLHVVHPVPIVQGVSSPMITVNYFVHQQVTYTLPMTTPYANGQGPAIRSRSTPQQYEDRQNPSRLPPGAYESHCATSAPTAPTNLQDHRFAGFQRVRFEDEQDYAGAHISPVSSPVIPSSRYEDEWEEENLPLLPSSAVVPQRSRNYRAGHRHGPNVNIFM